MLLVLVEELFDVVDFVLDLETEFTLVLGVSSSFIAPIILNIVLAFVIIGFIWYIMGIAWLIIPSVFWVFPKIVDQSHLPANPLNSPF